MFVCDTVSGGMCWEGGGAPLAATCMLPLADAFAQEVVVATLWTFSMQAVDVGALLLSAWLDIGLQRRHCRVKDWPYSQAVTQV